MTRQSPPATPFRPALPGRGTADGQGHATAGRVAPLPRQRRRSMLALGLVLAGLGALAGAWVYTATSHRAPVLAVTRDVPAGAQITPADLAPAVISGGSTLKTIPVRQEAQVTGQVAAVDLRAGTLLVPADLTSALVPGPGQQLVPVALKTGQLPASGLAPGEQVLVVATPGAAGQPSANQGGSSALAQDVSATVYRVSGPDQNGEVVVDLLVAAGQGPPVARQASTGQVGLVVTQGRR
jgi:SAF domain